MLTLILKKTLSSFTRLSSTEQEKNRKHKKEEWKSNILVVVVRR
jgi:hypothetical protein